MIKLGEFLPDQPDYNNAGATVATNVVPAANGYTSLSDVLPFSGATDAYIRGMTAAKDDSGSAAIYVGDETKLYKFDATDSSLDNISKSGNYSSGVNDVWNFVQFGESVIATNYADNIQTITAAGGGLFSDLSADAPKAKHIAVVRDFVMCANTNDVTDGEKPYRVRWSAIGDATDWAVSATTQADFQDISDMGAVTGIVGGEYATILMEKGIVRAQYVGSPLIFEFDKVQISRGCKIAGSVVSYGKRVFYLSDDGFYMFDGQQSTPIGAERVNSYFLKRFQSNFANRMSAVIDPLRQIVVWSYASADSDGSPDELIMYNYATNKWSTAEIGLDAMSPLFSAGYTLENLATISTNIDTLPSSLDSPVYKGGEYFFAGAKDNKIQTFTGATLPATIETGEFDVQAGKSSLINNVIPYVENKSGAAATISVQVASRSTQNEPLSFSAASTVNSDNFCPVRSSGRFHRIRLNLTGDWAHATGVDVDAQVRGRR
jgi:hypothetical protein